jgi:LysR family carnitine catabolism transcriptional activator
MSLSININLHQLEIFLLVAERKGFTKAAHSLGLTPSALSRSIHQLEDSLGARLLDRDTHTVLLTPEGREFIPIARRMLEERDRGLRHFDQFVTGQRHALRITALTSLSIEVLSPLLARFQQLHPEANLLFRDTLSGNVFQAVKAEEVDLGICCCLQPDPEISVEPLHNDPFYLLCRRDHPLAQRKSVSWSELANHPYIGCASMTAVRFFTDCAFLRAGVKVRHLFEPGSVAVLGSLVAHGLGATALPGMAIAAASRGYPNLVHIPLVEPVMERQVSIITKISRPPTRLMNEFRSLLREGIQWAGPSEPNFRPIAANGSHHALDSAPRTPLWR